MACSYVTLERQRRVRVSNTPDVLMVYQCRTFKAVDHSKYCWCCWGSMRSDWRSLLFCHCFHHSTLLSLSLHHRESCLVCSMNSLLELSAHYPSLGTSNKPQGRYQSLESQSDFDQLHVPNLLLSSNHQWHRDHQKIGKSECERNNHSTCGRFRDEALVINDNAFVTPLLLLGRC